ncbi:MAG: hypothetical protein GH151_04720 [Bacteroidetes bacterium]|nr:hypothetical protein [Bacteroidota bacterium]
MKQALQGLILLILALLYFQCARVGTPTGGEKDKSPPRVKKSIPENYSIHFEGDKIEIDFDEFFRLRELDQKLVVSPPLEEKPEILPKGKTLVIDLKNNELGENTTYTFNFSDAIVDNNEGNPIENFEFVFSTGNTIDSLSVTGTIIQAFDLQPEEDVFVMLYENLNDSAPIKEFPAYIAKADDEGKFRVNNIKADTFRVIGLKDMNLNYKFDLAGEPIAFMDSLLFIGMGKKTELVRVDTTQTGKALIKPPNIKLYLFTEEEEEQYLKSSERPSSYQIIFIFNKPLTTELIVNPVDFSPPNDWNLIEDYPNGDTISYWIKDSTIANTEVLTTELIYPVKDSTGVFKPYSDTVTLRYSKPVKARRKRRQETEQEEQLLKLGINVTRGSRLDLNSNILIESPTPVLNIDTSMINILKIEDTVEIEQDYRFFIDSIRIRKFWIWLPWEENSSYKIWIEPGAFEDIYGIKNDTVIIPFRTQEMDFYGNLIVSVQNVKTGVIVQLLDEKNNKLKEEYIENDKEVKFTYLYPKKYKLKVIFDKNKNGIWDTGNYLKKIQPEKVLSYSKEINIRANWDLEIDWDIEAKNKK